MEKIKKTILQAVTTGNTQGSWNANFNIPNITAETEMSNMWYVSVSGETVLGDIDTWNVGDWAVKLDSGWGKVIIDNLDIWVLKEDGSWEKVINGLTGSTGSIVRIPDLNITNYFKIGLKQSAQDIGFFDAFSEPPEPIPPEPPGPPTFYLLDSASNQFVDNNGDNFIYE
jgi:hypothetical protein